MALVLNRAASVIAFVTKTPTYGVHGRSTRLKFWP